MWELYISPDILSDGEWDAMAQSMEWARDRFILGSPEECYEQLRPYWEGAGVNYLLLRTHWTGLPLSAALQSMRLISDELLPALRRVSIASGGSPPRTGTGD